MRKYYYGLRHHLSWSRRLTMSQVDCCFQKGKAIHKYTSNTVLKLLQKSSPKTNPKNLASPPFRFQWILKSISLFLLIFVFLILVITSIQLKTRLGLRLVAYTYKSILVYILYLTLLSQYNYNMKSICTKVVTYFVYLDICP